MTRCPLSATMLRDDGRRAGAWRRFGRVAGAVLLVLVAAACGRRDARTERTGAGTGAESLPATPVDTPPIPRDTAPARRIDTAPDTARGRQESDKDSDTVCTPPATPVKPNIDPGALRQPRKVPRPEPRRRQP